MQRTFFSICLLLAVSSLAAQKKEGTTYLVFNAANMSTLEYRSTTASAYPGISQVLRLRTAADEYYFLEIGTGIYSSNVPANAQNSQGFLFTDQYMSDINNRKSALQMVQPAGSQSVVSPVLSVTRVVYSGDFILLNGADYSLMIDKSHSITGNNVAMAGSLRDVILLNSTKKSCKELFTFRRISNLAGSEMVDFDFIPGLGIVGERIGRSSDEMRLNERQLLSIDGISVDQLLQTECGTSLVTTSPKSSTSTGTVQQIGSKVDERTYFGDDFTSKGVMISAISNHPIADCGKNAEPGYHIVQPKETISSIARFYGLSPRNIIEWNQIEDPNVVKICQELRILHPGAKTVPHLKNPIILTRGLSAASLTSKTPSTKVESAQILVPTAPATTLIAGQSGRFYAVQAGESFYQVARKFGYTEDRLRTMNGLPSTGEVPLQVGQMLKVSDCEDQDSPVPAPLSPGITRSAPFSEKDNPILVLNNAPSVSEPVPFSTSTTNATTTIFPKGSSTTNSSPFVPLNNSPAAQLALTPTVQAYPTPKMPIAYQEYKVSVGESIRSIANKKKLDPTELGLINGRAVDEMLPVGTKLNIPVY